MQLSKPLKLFTSKNWAWIFLQTVFLFFLFLFYNNGDFVLNGEEKLLTKIDVAKEMLLSNPKPRYDFVFINVGKDLEVVQDENGGDAIITNRAKLAALFKVLATRNEHRYLLADIYFDLYSENDSLLAVEIKKLNRVIFPKHLSDTGILPTVIPVPAAVADYRTNVKKFSKFRLIYRDSLKTIPVTMHEELQQVSYSTGFLGFFYNGNYCLQTFPPRYYIRPHHLLNTKEYPYFNLGELLVLSNDSLFYNQFLQKKFIVLGNFETDIHETPIGVMPGSLILLNTYLSLLNGKHQPGVWWFIFLFALFFIINMFLFFGKIKVPEIAKNKIKWWQVLIKDQLKSQLANLFSVAGICLLITIISEFMFQIKPHTFIIFIYIISWQSVIKYHTIWKEQRN